MNYTGVVESSVQNQVSVQVSQLEQTFTKGVSHTVVVFATNSAGTSSPQSTQLIVPCELPQCYSVPQGTCMQLNIFTHNSILSSPSTFIALSLSRYYLPLALHLNYINPMHACTGVLQLNLFLTHDHFLTMLCCCTMLLLCIN